jgi:hypothetical protein
VDGVMRRFHVEVPETGERSEAPGHLILLLAT